jgi:hypothetical protein
MTTRIGAQAREEAVSMQAMRRDLPRGRWRACLDDLDRERSDTPTVLQVSRRLGHVHTEERGLLLRSVSYDPRRDVFEVTVARPTPRGEELLEHVVDHPVRLLVDSPEGILPAAVAVEDRSGDRTVLRLVPSPDFGG